MGFEAASFSIIQTHTIGLAEFFVPSPWEEDKNKFFQVFSQAQLKLTYTLVPEWPRDPQWSLNPNIC